MVSRKARKAIGFCINYLAIWGSYPLEFDSNSLSIHFTDSKWKINLCRCRIFLTTIMDLAILVSFIKSLALNELTFTTFQDMAFVFYVFGTNSLGILDFVTTWNLKQTIACFNSTFALHDALELEMLQKHGMLYDSIERRPKKLDISLYFIYISMSGPLFVPILSSLAYVVECELHILFPIHPICVYSTENNDWTHNDTFFVIPLAIMQCFYFTWYACQFGIHMIMIPQSYAVIEMLEELRLSQFTQGIIGKQLFRLYRSCQILNSILSPYRSRVLPVMFIFVFILITIINFGAIGVQFELATKVAIASMNMNLMSYLFLIFTISRQLSESSVVALDEKEKLILTSFNNYSKEERRYLKKMFRSCRKIHMKIGPFRCSDNDAISKVFDGIVDYTITLLVAYNHGQT